jgi:hypothetical protein
MSGEPYDPTRELEAVPPAREVTRDHCSRIGAERLARELDEWWHSRGHPHVRHIVTLAQRVPKKSQQGSDEEPSGKVWVVRSNLVGGLPPG